MSSYDLLAAVSSHISHFKPFRKTPKLSKGVFAYDITLIALAIK